MPLIDMPLDELRQYGGINPAPADFDAYWATALAEQAATEPAVELRPAALQIDHVTCSHLFFTGVGGARVHAKLVQPKASANASGAAVLRFHGYGGSSGDWLPLLAYAGAGITIAALDCRGQAGLSEDTGGVRGNTHRGHIIRGLADGPDKLLFRQIFLDTAQLARVVAGLDGVDPDRLGAFGGSQGGGLTLACAGLVPSLRRAAPTYPFLSDYQRV
jgi:cephalosporin-C deacetylase